MLLVLFLTGVKTGWAEPQSSLNLFISHTESQRIYNTKQIQTRESAITVYRAEQISRDLAGRLIGGYQEQIQDKNTIAAAQYAVGYFVGFSLNYDVFRATSYRFNIFSQYQYHQLEGRNGDQRVNINWYDITFGIRQYYSVSSRFNLLADVSYIHLSGSERAFEPLSQSVNFENESEINYSLGMAYFISSSGYVGIKTLAGFQQGFQLIFAKDY